MYVVIVLFFDIWSSSMAYFVPLFKLFHETHLVCPLPGRVVSR